MSAPDRQPLNLNHLRLRAATVAMALAVGMAVPAALTSAQATAARPAAVQAKAHTPRGHSVRRVHHRERRIDRSRRRTARPGRLPGRLPGRRISHPKRQAHPGRQTHPGRQASLSRRLTSKQGPASVASVLAVQCQNTEETPTPGNIAEVDAATLCLVNQERARHDEQPLQPNARLQRAAQSHSEEMIGADYFAHVSPSGETPLQRILATGYVPSSQDGYTIGENIAWGTLQLSTPASIVAAWIASPEHLANILYAPYRDTAVAIVPQAPPSLSEGQAGAVYSQEFGVIVT